MAYQKASIRTIESSIENASCGVCAGKDVTRCPAPVNPGLPNICLPEFGLTVGDCTAGRHYG